MSIKLPTVRNEGLADEASYGSAATLLTIPSDGVPWAAADFRHLGTAGYWYISFGGNTPSTTSYSIKLAPGEPRGIDNPPEGAIKILAGSGVDGHLEYFVDWSL